MTEDVEVALSHCGQSMTYKGARHGWEGEDELATWRYACAACGATAEVVTRIPIGPPA